MSGPNYCRRIGTCSDALEKAICETALPDIWPEYSRPIAAAIVEDVARDIWETADRKHWNDVDLRLAVGRTLCSRCGGTQ